MRPPAVRHRSVSRKPATAGETGSLSPTRSLLHRADLGATIQPRLEVLLAVGAHLGLPLYLVGGAVRDGLLGLAVRDLDVTVLGPVEHLAAELARRLGGRVRSTPVFLTAAVELPGGEEIDLAAARRERYPQPAALPAVEAGDLGSDLARRDFSLNALAVRLKPAASWPVLDPCGGLADLASRRLRALHERSFVDDPTRAFRGARLATRLQLTWDRETLLWLRLAQEHGAFTALSASRLRRELELCFATDTEQALATAAELAKLGLWQAIAPELGWSRSQESAWRALVAAWRASPFADEPAPSWEIALLVLGISLPAQVAALASRLGLVGRARHALLEAPTRCRVAAPELAGTASLGRLEAILRPLRPLEQCALAALEGETSRQQLERYWREALPFELMIRAGDLIATGIAPGPAIGRALAATRRARLDGEIGAAGELRYALAHAAAAT